MSHTKEEKTEAFGRLIDILDILREKCPWDHKQTNESLRPNTIEETYELCDALIRHDNEATKKELGDVLLHIAFYAKIGEENGTFDIADVCNALCDKLVYRHPHVFGTTHVDGSKEVEQNWEQLKLKDQSLPHTGQGSQRRIRLGRKIAGLGQGSRRVRRTESRNRPYESREYGE